MSDLRRIAVIDIGKSNAKVALVDLASLSEIDVVTRPNTVRRELPYPHFDTEAHWRFITGALARFQSAHGVDAISVTTHGASIVLVTKDGDLATPILDYEHDGPDSLAAAYDPLRPPFAETGSPRLPMGLNVGAQLHWLLETQPGLRARAARIVTYPQYWTGRLTGIWSTEVTSLGCHTDLWNPQAETFSPLVDALGIRERMAPARHAGERIGPILPGIAATTGLAPETPVFCGIHNSNASLYPHILSQEPPFSVLSTGTWVIAMAVGSVSPALDPARDTLVNVDALGNPVPSARFMGGRAFEIMTGGSPTDPEPREIARILDESIALLPSVVPESGPFQGRKHSWTTGEATLSPGEITAATSLYLGIMAAICLEMIGADGPVIAEGPLARNPLFLDMIAAATGRPVLVPGGSATGTSIGAALLALGPSGGAAVTYTPRETPGNLDALKAYATRWHALCAAT